MLNNELERKRVRRKERIIAAKVPGIIKALYFLYVA